MEGRKEGRRQPPPPTPGISPTYGVHKSSVGGGGGGGVFFCRKEEDIVEEGKPDNLEPWAKFKGEKNDERKREYQISQSALPLFLKFHFDK